MTNQSKRHPCQYWYKLPSEQGVRWAAFCFPFCRYRLTFLGADRRFFFWFYPLPEMLRKYLKLCHCSVRPLPFQSFAHHRITQRYIITDSVITKLQISTQQDERRRCSVCATWTVTVGPRCDRRGQVGTSSSGRKPIADSPRSAL
jgi:hypothetical protein